MSPLSDVQFSRHAEMEVAKLLTFGSGGLLECMLPLTDDERRVIETHIKEHFRLSVALQVKASYVLYHVGRAPRLQKSFVVKPERLIDDPFFWYLPVGNPLGKSVASQHENRLRLHGEKGPHATPPSLQT